MVKHNHPLANTLKNININSCPYECNFHMHTTFSDGSLSPLELVKQALKYNIKNIAVTDHHNIQAYYVIKDWLDFNKVSKNDLQLWTGVEITCLLNGSLVHILGLGFDSSSEYLAKYTNNQSPNSEDLSSSKVIKSIHRANGLSILAHPARYKKPFKDLIDAAISSNIDGVEVWYDYERSKSWTPSDFVCKKIDSYSKSLGLLATCGTDTHGLSILRR